ncbi:TRAP transporter large permease [Thermodesulfobacteriota bacterium]
MGLEVILALILLLVLLMFGVPIALALLASGFTGLLLIGDLYKALASLTFVPYATVANGNLIVIPLFILTGQIAFAAGISQDAYDMAYRWLGKFKGGLAMASIAACGAFAATSGSSVATAATVGKIAIPEMRRFGYDDSLATGAVAAGGSLGIMIPPSTTFIIYGIITDTSIGKLLIAGIIPGLISAVIYILGISVLTRVRPNIAPGGKSFPWGEKFRYLLKGSSILILFFTIIGGIYSGLFTPSEAAAVGGLVAIILAIVKRAKMKELLTAFSDSAGTAAMIFLLLVGAMVFSQFVAITGTAADVAEFLGSIPLPNLVVLFIILIFYVPMGMFLDGISMMLVTMPVVFPAVLGMGYDAIWFGVIITKMIEISVITPPVGFNVFIIKGVVPEVPIETIYRGVMFFLLLDLITLSLLVIFPEIVLWLPNKLF